GAFEALVGDDAHHDDLGALREIGDGADIRVPGRDQAGDMHRQPSISGAGWKAPRASLHRLCACPASDRGESQSPMPRMESPPAVAAAAMMLQAIVPAATQRNAVRALTPRPTATSAET